MGIRRMLVKRMLKTWEIHDNEILSGQTLPGGIVELSNIPYINDGTKAHSLDVYYPENAAYKLPVIIDIHGGGFVYGDKALNRAFCHYLAAKGFVVFNLNYRLALYDTKVPGQIQDVMKAIKWISENIDKYPADKENAFIVGDSAGGVLAVMATLIAQSRRLQAVFKTVDTGLTFKAVSVISGMMRFQMKGLSYRVLRSICFDRGYSKKEYYQNMIFDNIPEIKDLPPVFLTTSEEDELGFMTVDFEKILKRLNVKYYIKNYQKRDDRKLGHIFCVQYPGYDESKEIIDEMTGFFQSAVAAKQA